MHTMEEALSHKWISHATPTHRWRSNQYYLFLKIRIDKIQVHAHTLGYVHRKYGLTKLPFSPIQNKNGEVQMFTYSCGLKARSFLKKKTCLKTSITQLLITNRLILVPNGIYKIKQQSDIITIYTQTTASLFLKQLTNMKKHMTDIFEVLIEKP